MEHRRKLTATRRKFVPHSDDIQERTKNEFISNMFSKIKIDDDGKIKIDEGCKTTCQKLEEHASTPGPSSSNSSSELLSPLDKNEDGTKSKHETLPQPQESDISETSNTTLAKAFQLVASSSYPDQNENKSKQKRNRFQHNGENSSSIQPEGKKPTLSQHSTSSVAPLSSPAAYDLQMTSEFQQILKAIKSRDISQLEKALMDHLRLLHISTPDHLIQLSIKEALLSSNIRILDLVYEHWATAALTSPSEHIETNLKRLTETMIAATDFCLVFETVRLAHQCLIAYNNFRIHLHQKLFAFQESTSFDNETEKEKQNIITALNIYKDYSEKYIGLTSFEVINERVYKSLAEDSTNEHKNFLMYNIFELYYRKLDLRISEIIIEYVNNAIIFNFINEDVTKAVYYLLYRADEAIYLQGYGKLKLKHVMSNNALSDLNEHLFDPSRLVPYLERAEFKKAVDRFLHKLENPSSVIYSTERFWLADPGEISRPIFNMCQDNLKMVYLSKKLVIYLEQCMPVIQLLPTNDCLLLEKQILKTIYIHLEDLDGLIFAHFPSPVCRQLKNLLRWRYSKTNQCQLTILLYLEETHPDLCLEVAKEIDQIKNVIANDIKIRKSIVDKHLLGNLLKLVSGKINKLQDENSSLKVLVNELLYLDREELLATLKGNNTYFNKCLPKYELTLELFSEFIILVYNMKILKRDLNNKKIVCIENLIDNWQVYTDCVETALNYIEQNITIDKYTKSIMYNNPLVYDYWSNINSILHFLSTEFKLGLYIPSDLPDIIKEMNEVRNFLYSLQQESKNLTEIYELNTSPNRTEKFKTYKFEAMQQLTELLMKTKFLTKQEKEYLMENVDRDFRQTEKSAYLPLLAKVLRGEEISTEERDVILMNIDMNDRCQDIVRNLVTGSERKDCALQCLAVRAASLKNAIDGNHLAQLVQRYKIDEAFQCLVNTLLLDMKYPKCFEDLSNMSFKLLKKRHPQETDSVFKIDVELVKMFSSVLKLVEDEPILKELWKLQENGLSREEVMRSWKGSHSPRLEDYFKLLPSSFSFIQTNFVQQASFIQTKDKLKNSDKDNTEKLLLGSTKLADEKEPPSLPEVDLNNLVQTWQIPKAPSDTTISPEPLALIPMTALSAVMSSASDAAQAAVSAAAAASTAAQAAVFSATAAQVATSVPSTTAAVAQATSNAVQVALTAVQAATTATQAVEKVRAALASIIASANTTDSKS